MEPKLSELFKHAIYHDWEFGNGGFCKSRLTKTNLIVFYSYIIYVIKIDDCVDTI